LAIAAGQAENAVQPLEQALAEDPDNVEVMQTLAYAYAGVRRVDDAAEMMAEALAAIPPNSPFFRHFVGPWTQQLKAWQSQ
jgi:Flp pilus assembly protein TadD